MAIIDFGITVSTAPTTEPLTSAEAKAWLRVTDSEQDSLISSLISQAREAVEIDSRRSLMTQTIDLSLDAWPDCYQIELLRPPIQSISYIKYYDVDGTLTTWSSGNYSLDAARACVQISQDATLPILDSVANSISVRYVAGYTSAANVPQGLKHAMLLQIACLFENREMGQQESFAYDSLITRYKRRTYP